MATANANRLWVLGGALGAIVLLALGWFLVISPQNAETRVLHEQVDAAEANLVGLQKRLAVLREQNRDLERYKAELARDRAALPDEAAMADFLRELQSAGSASGVTVGGVTVGPPTAVTVSGGTAHSLPLTLNAQGTPGKLAGFLRQLQEVQPRAVLITAATLSPAGQGTSLASGAGLTLDLRAFVAPTT
ncbi:MAG TPA: type 4a pilus biogenesis protein PilO [Pilimelia sp.]|nr:type 4a pilus biogenesis protein PilO [Pilimelia sp.]